MFKNLFRARRETNYQSLLKALKECSDNNKIIKLNYLNTCSEFSLPYTVNLKILFNKIEINSWGTDKDKEIAYIKAIMELVERVTFLKNRFKFKKDTFRSYGNERNQSFQIKDFCQINNRDELSIIGNTTSGMSVQTDFHQAFIHAKTELIERDTITRKLWLGLPPYDVSEIAFDLLTDYSFPKEVEVNFYCWPGACSHLVVVMKSHVQDKGNYFSSSASLNLNDAILKAFYEGVGALIHANLTSKLLHNNKNLVLTSNQFKHRFNCYPHLEYIFSKAKREELPKKEKLNCNIRFFYYEIPLEEELGNHSLCCLKVISPDLKVLVNGSWSKKYLHPSIKNRLDDCLEPSFPPILG